MQDKSQEVEAFNKHIKSVNSYIKFTREDVTDEKQPFLACKSQPLADANLLLTVNNYWWSNDSVVYTVFTVPPTASWTSWTNWTSSTSQTSSTPRKKWLLVQNTGQCWTNACPNPPPFLSLSWEASRTIPRFRITNNFVASRLISWAECSHQSLLPKVHHIIFLPWQLLLILRKYLQLPLIYILSIVDQHSCPYPLPSLGFHFFHTFYFHFQRYSNLNDRYRQWRL